MKLKDLIKELQNQSDSQAHAIAEVLESAEGDEELGLAILDEFKGWAEYGLKKLDPASRRAQARTKYP